MSNKSRARHVLYADDAPDPDEVAEAEAQTDRMSRVADAFATPGRKGLDKLVALLMDDAPTRVGRACRGAEVVDNARKVGDGGMAGDPVRTPTPYEAAMTTAIGGQNTYAGTVEPWRVAERRRHNKAARAMRRRQRRLARR